MAMSEIKQITVWGRDLSTLPDLSSDDVRRIARENVKTHTNSTKRGYAFFWDEYVEHVEVRQCADGHDVRAKCKASMRKSQLPHRTQLKLATKVRRNDTVVIVKQHKCSCRAGTGFCQHEIGLLFQLAHYQLLGVKKIPLIKKKAEKSCTSKRQKWHVPARISRFATRSLPEVQIITPREAPGGDKRVDSGVRSKLYNPITVPLSTLHFMEKLLPSMRSKATPPQWLQLWSRQEEVVLAQSNFGAVPRGSLLSYHEKVVPLEVIREAEPFNLPALRPLQFAPDHLSADEKVVIHSLSVTMEESALYEKSTRPQAKCPEWHRLRKNRLTASKFKMITGRREKFAALADDLLTKKTRMTAAMQRGNDEEDNVARSYASRYGFDIFPVGLVINPSIPHLGCSPDRRVFDASANPQWGLLEVKTTVKDSVSECPYLKSSKDGLQLRHIHAHYEQCLGQMGLTGAKWCDFYVQAEDDYHCERIWFVEADFQAMREKLDSFFLSFLLPAIVKND